MAAQLVSSTWHELALETHLVVHVEQITGGAACECAATVAGVKCHREAVLFITSEPDLEPGPVCSEHGFGWLDGALGMLKQLYPPEQ